MFKRSYHYIWVRYGRSILEFHYPYFLLSSLALARVLFIFLNLTRKSDWGFSLKLSLLSRAGRADILECFGLYPLMSIAYPMGLISFTGASWWVALWARNRSNLFKSIKSYYHRQKHRKPRYAKKQNWMHLRCYDNSSSSRSPSLARLDFELVRLSLRRIGREATLARARTPTERKNVPVFTVFLFCGSLT